MRVDLLRPHPDNRENFRRSRQSFIPEFSGCYVLTSFHGIVLYVGLSNNLKRRFGEHLDDPVKTFKNRFDTVFFFYWLKCANVETVERTWLNECELVDGRLPPLNLRQSPCVS